MPTRPFFILDVFAESKYAGNQLGVVLNANDIPAADMQRIARETNFAETTFVLSDAPRDGGYDVRIFTPKAEVPFAGHPTIGTAWLIRNEILAEKPEELTLNLGVGPIRVTFEHANDLAWLHQTEPEFGAEFNVAKIAELFGIEEQDIDAGFPVQSVSMGIEFVVIPLRSQAALKRANFNRERCNALAIPELPQLQFLFCPEPHSDENDLCARMFADAYGVPEDPATGSANACLAGYLLRQQCLEHDSIDIRVEQGHEIDRPSLLHVRGRATPDGMAISVGGRVVMTARGELL